MASWPACKSMQKSFAAEGSFRYVVVPVAMGDGTRSTKHCVVGSMDDASHLLRQWEGARNDPSAKLVRWCQDLHSLLRLEPGAACAALDVDWNGSNLEVLGRLGLQHWRSFWPYLCQALTEMFLEQPAHLLPAFAFSPEIMVNDAAAEETLSSLDPTDSVGPAAVLLHSWHQLWNFALLMANNSPFAVNTVRACMVFCHSNRLEGGSSAFSPRCGSAGTRGLNYRPLWMWFNLLNRYMAMVVQSAFHLSVQRAITRAATGRFEFHCPMEPTSRGAELQLLVPYSTAAVQAFAAQRDRAMCIMSALFDCIDAIICTGSGANLSDDIEWHIPEPVVLCPGASWSASAVTPPSLLHPDGGSGSRTAVLTRSAAAADASFTPPRSSSPAQTTADRAATTEAIFAPPPPNSIVVDAAHSAVLHAQVRRFVRSWAHVSNTVAEIDVRSALWPDDPISNCIRSAVRISATTLGKQHAPVLQLMAAIAPWLQAVLWEWAAAEDGYNFLHKRTVQAIFQLYVPTHADSVPVGDRGNRKRKRAASAAVAAADATDTRNEAPVTSRDFIRSVDMALAFLSCPPVRLHRFMPHSADTDFSLDCPFT